MSDLGRLIPKLPPDQEAIRAKCFHPTGTFVEFEREEINQSISTRFEKIVAQYPHRLAVKMGHRALTYRELNSAANRVARAILAKLGKGQEPVGLLFESGVEAVTAILGVLKAGKFYVPLDPSFPQGRIVSILGDSGVKLLATDNANISLAHELTRGRFDLLDVDMIDAWGSSENLSTSLSPADLASIIYTSGSTGQPKGVVQNHRCLLHWAMIYTNDLNIMPNDRLTLLNSWSAPVCVHHLFGSLLNGASLFPLDPRLIGGEQLARWLMQEQVTLYHSVPMVFRQIAAALTGKEAFASLRMINLSGAPISRNDVELYKNHFASACILLHSIGTTETGWIRRYFIDKTGQITGNAVPIGYTVQDTEVTLLDDGGHEMGFEQVGQIAIKSRYLASGYWRKPALTKAKFIPCANGGDQRIYLTGDLGRMEADGCLFHLGRKDFQVKVRGYRVEIGEVEIALLEHPAVKETAVVGRQVPSGDTQLVAYFVPTEGHVPTVTQLRSFLKEKLPDYMIPSAFMTLAALPLTPNGKLDYQALPTPERCRPALDAAYVAPKSEIEQLIATVWREVLGLEKVGLHDNYFDLGGQSLLLAQVHSKLQEIFRNDFPIVDLFKHTTIKALVKYVGQKQNGSTKNDMLENLKADKNRLKQLSQQR